MNQKTYADWLRTHKKQFNSISDYRKWQRDRKACWRATHSRKYKAELRRTAKRNRIRTEKLRALIFSEAVRRILNAKAVKHATFAVFTAKVTASAAAPL